MYWYFPAQLSEHTLGEIPRALPDLRPNFENTDRPLFASQDKLRRSFQRLLRSLPSPRERFWTPGLRKLFQIRMRK